MTVSGKLTTAIALALATVIISVVLVMTSLAPMRLVPAVVVLLLAEMAKTFFLLKRYSDDNGRNGLGATVIAEVITFLVAAALVAALVYFTDETCVVCASAFCLAFIILRVASGIVIFSKS